MDTFQNLLKICEILDDKKAEDILLIDTTKMNNVGDYYILATASSNTHARGLAEYLETETLKLTDIEYVMREGFGLSEWIVLDFNNIFVHIFTKQKREYYCLEKLLNEGNNIKQYEKIKKENTKQEQQKIKKDKTLEKLNAKKIKDNKPQTPKGKK